MARKSSSNDEFLDKISAEVEATKRRVDRAEAIVQLKCLEEIDKMTDDERDTACIGMSIKAVELHQPNSPESARIIKELREIAYPKETPTLIPVPLPLHPL